MLGGSGRNSKSKAYGENQPHHVIPHKILGLGHFGGGGHCQLYRKRWGSQRKLSGSERPKVGSGIPDELSDHTTD